METSESTENATSSGGTTRVGVVRESGEGERRVALVPKIVASLIGKGVEVVVESGAGLGALIPDELYVAAGATIGDPWSSDVVVKVAPPTEAEIAKYYNEHIADYHTDPQRRALVLKVRTEKFARDIHAELVQGKSEPDVQKRILAFRKLSARHSIERALSTKGGDVGFLPPADKLRNNKEVSRRVFELQNIGDFTEPYLHESVWHIVMMMDKRPERTRPLEAVSGEIRQELYETRRKALREKFIEELRAKAKIEIEKDNLAKIEPPEGDSQMLDKTLMKKSSSGSIPGSSARKV